MTVFMITLGCKVNQYESQAMQAMLEESGFTAAADEQAADVIVINSCTVTGASDQKTRQALHRARRKNPGAVIALTGCMPQAYPKAAAALAEADIVVGNACRKRLAPFILEYLAAPRRIVAIDAHERGEEFEALHVTDFHERTRAFIKIEDGCNRFCSYCVIPIARGRVRSKPLEALRRELEGIAAAGYREAVLVGINLPAYGQDLGLTLCDAVDVACAVEGIERVRLGSLEPDRLDAATVARMAAQKKLCPQFHLSLQSGCDQTLRRMNRHYTAEEYASIVAMLRAAFPCAAITTDIMVGFAGETQEEFAQSLRFAKDIGFAKAHIFAYSPRAGTVAALQPDQIPSREKEERSRRMIAATEESRRHFLREQVGQTAPVLFETTPSAGVWEGFTPNYTPVRVVGEGLHGKILPVTLTDAQAEFCTGRIANE